MAVLLISIGFRLLGSVAVLGVIAAVEYPVNGLGYPASYVLESTQL
jgi:hypothetical protein